MNTHLPPAKHGKGRSLLFFPDGSVRPSAVEPYKEAMKRIPTLPSVEERPDGPEVRLQQRGPVADQSHAIGRVWKFRSSLVKCKGCDAPTTYESRDQRATEGHVFWCYTCGRKDLRVVFDEDTAQLIEAQILSRKVAAREAARVSVESSTMRLP